MFNTCRRGPASICKIANATTTSVSPLARTSRLPILAQSFLKPTINSRQLHISSILQAYGRDGGRGRDMGRGGGGGGGYGGRGRSRRPSRYDEDEFDDDNVEGTGDYTPTITEFQALADEGMVHPTIIRNITQGMGHQTMTDVQAMTIKETLSGADAIAQAKTGTGKTLGFLVPVLNKILKDTPELAEAPQRRSDRARPSDIRGLIISPTRELAEQIATEARKLTRGTGLVTQVAVGGTGKREMLWQMQREGCHLLVGTPGRLVDLFSDPYSKVKAPGLTALVLDEADRLLDDGFSEAIEEIVDLLPPKHEVDRQTLMFSATVPKKVMSLVKRTLKPDFHVVQTVKAGDQATHEKIPQHLVQVRGLENIMPTILELAKRQIDAAAKASAAGEESTPFKAIVYYSNLAAVELAGDIFQSLRASGSGSLFGRHPLSPAQTFVMHSKLTQHQRTRISERFRQAKSAIMFSSDVTARGMDFPNVTHVIQVGVPPKRDAYIHRVGRTGRGDKSGEGILILHELEMNEARRRLRGIPLQPNNSLQAAKVDMSQPAELSVDLASTFSQVADATKMVDRSLKTSAYMVLLSNFAMGTRSPQDRIDAINDWTRYGWGWEKPPGISASTAQKFTMGRATGLNIVERRSAEDFDGPSRQSNSDRGFSGSRGRRDDRSFGRDSRDRRGFGQESRGQAQQW